MLIVAGQDRNRTRLLQKYHPVVLQLGPLTRERRFVTPLVTSFTGSHFQPVLPRKLAPVRRAPTEVEKQPGSLLVVGNTLKNVFERTRIGRMGDDDLVLLGAVSRHGKVFAIVECGADRPVVAAELLGQETSHGHKRLTANRERDARDVQVVGQKQLKSRSQITNPRVS